MRIQPRQEILAAWAAIARHSYRQQSWHWGGREGRNSISDAEQLLCLMAPATEIPLLRLDEPDQTADDVIAALETVGDTIEVPLILIDVLVEYLDTYADEDGTPTFSGGSRFTSVTGETGSITPEQRGLDVVDSFATSVTLMLATLGFLRVFRRAVTRDDLVKQVDGLAESARRRLTAAMVGLLRSFAVNVFTPTSEFGKEQLDRVNQDGRRTSLVADELRAALQDIRVRLQDDIVRGLGVPTRKALDNPHQLFECGWSWSIVRDAPVTDFAPAQDQRAGVAENAPYLYFTAVALDAIEALFSERTRLLGLIDETQSELAQQLQIRYELTRSFWSTIATFGSGARWPLEDLPWRTTDGLQYTYYSLLVSGMVVQQMATNRATPGDVARVGTVLEKLADRSRITSRATEDDAAVVRAHDPGVREPLREFPDQVPELAWTVADVGPLLLKRTLQLAGLLVDGAARDRMLALADQIWGHLTARRLAGGDAIGLWDQPAGAFPDLVPAREEVSWYHTKRVIDCLISAGLLVSGPPPESPHLSRTAAELLREADHLLQGELFRGAGTSGERLQEELVEITYSLGRARAVHRDRPGVALALAEDALRRLDRFAAARSAHGGTG